jgi:hypothetical protein
MLLKEIQMKQIFLRIAMLSLLVNSTLAFAEEHRERHRDGRQHQRYSEHDVNIWRGGNWHRENHQGHFGWWWVAGGAWYLYPQPVYPYPEPYSPPVTVINERPAVVQQSEPAFATAHTVAPPALYWHFCDSAREYFPALAICPEGWKSVPVSSPQSSPQ